MSSVLERPFCCYDPEVDEHLCLAPSVAWITAVCQHEHVLHLGACADHLAEFAENTATCGPCSNSEHPHDCILQELERQEIGVE
jgi:hypothetical protein